MHLVFGAEDWEAVDKAQNHMGGKPKHDVTGDDGMKISVGDASVRIVTTQATPRELFPTCLRCVITADPCESPMWVAQQSRSTPTRSFTTATSPRRRRWRRPPPNMARRSCSPITPNSITLSSRPMPQTIARIVKRIRSMSARMVYALYLAVVDACATADRIRATGK